MYFFNPLKAHPPKPLNAGRPTNGAQILINTEDPDQTQVTLHNIDTICRDILPICTNKSKNKNAFCLILFTHFCIVTVDLY